MRGERTTIGSPAAPPGRSIRAVWTRGAGTPSRSRSGPARASERADVGHRLEGRRPAAVAPATCACHDDHHHMRYPEGHKEAVRASIVESAARVLRRDGLDGVSIPALMKEAGLTHGGFYGYFKNRDELV